MATTTAKRPLASEASPSADLPPSKRARKTRQSSAEICQQLREIAGSRSAKRVQAQIALTGTPGGPPEPTGLYVITAKDISSPDEPYITNVVYPLLWCLMHPACPLSTYRLSKEQFSSLPMAVPDALKAPSIRYPSMLKVSDEINRMFHGKLENQEERAFHALFTARGTAFVRKNNWVDKDTIV